jgi:hypothetical protein
MGGDIARQIEQTVANWPGVTVEPHRFGGIEFRVGRERVVSTTHPRRRQPESSSKQELQHSIGELLRNRVHRVVLLALEHDEFRVR